MISEEMFLDLMARVDALERAQSTPDMIVTKLDARARLPERAYPDDAGLDLFACLSDELWIHPGRHVAVPTGIALAIPTGYEGQVRPRSGLANKYGISIRNSPGTIDAGYRGGVVVLLANHGKMPFCVEPEAKIAQLVIAKVMFPRLIEGELPAAQRDTAGFGSTGNK